MRSRRREWIRAGGDPLVRAAPEAVARRRGRRIDPTDGGEDTMNILQLRRRAALGLLLVSACVRPPERQVTAWPQISDRDGTAALARPSDRILSSELRALDANTVAEAIRQLRPEFLQTAP